MSAPPRFSRHRSRRLRKKLHVGEFTTLGFRVRFPLSPELDPSASDAFWDAFLAEIIEPHALTFGGSDEGGVVIPVLGSATEAHRASVRDWFASRAEVTRVEVGPLFDVWYG